MVTGDTGNGSVLSWSGKYGNLSKEQVLDHIFDYDMGNVSTNGFGNVTHTFFLPFGMCRVAFGPTEEIRQGYILCFSIISPSYHLRDFFPQ